jgi:glycosyltransferase involved in cell wall biosynthesis
MNALSSPASPNRRYRILYHHRTQALDGQRVHIREIQKALVAMGHDVMEVSPVPSTEQAGGEQAAGLKRSLMAAVAEHTPAGAYELLELGYNVPIYSRLARAIRRFRPDFIYERYSINTVAGVWASRRYGVPLLLEANSPLADEKKALGKVLLHSTARRIEQYLLANATRTLAVSEVLKSRFMSAYSVPSNQIIVVHNGVDRARFDAAAAQRDRLRRELGISDGVVIGAVGFFREWHGIDLLLKAMRHDPEIGARARLMLVGDGPVLSALRELTRTLDLGNRVVFVGSVSHDNVPAYVAAADVVVIPRATPYASPLKLFEYMVAGKAIIAPRQQNIEEILTDGRDALFFTPENDAELRAAVRRVVIDTVLSDQLGRGARDTIERVNLTWAGNAERIVRAYESIRHVGVSPVVLASSQT